LHVVGAFVHERRRNFMVYGESTDEGPIQCFLGESSMTVSNGAAGLVIAYPGATPITTPGACAVVAGANGTITIDVPLSQVSLDPASRPSARSSTASPRAR
jgi:type 1 fimbria pilin